MANIHGAPGAGVDPIAPTINTIVQKLPEWFAAIFALVYLTGYLADFFFYYSIGIPEVGLDVLKLRYIQTGLFFYLIFICIGGVGYLIREARHNAAATSFQGRNRWTYSVAVLFQSSVVLAITFVPPAVFREFAARAAFGALILFNVVVYLFLVRRLEGRSPAAMARYSTWIAIGMIVVIVLCDCWIFGEPLSAILDSLRRTPWDAFQRIFGVALFLLFTISFFLTVERLVQRVPNLTVLKDDMEYTVSMAFMLLGLFYLSVSAYAYTILPFIPFERGGASFCHAPLAVVSERDEKGETTVHGIIVYATSDTIYVANTAGAPNSCFWRSGADFPPITGMPKEESVTWIGRADPSKPMTPPRKSSTPSAPAGRKNE